MLFCGALDGAIPTPSTRSRDRGVSREPRESSHNDSRALHAVDAKAKIRRGEKNWSQATGSGRNESGSSHEAVGAVVGTTVGTDVAPSSHQKLSSLALVQALSELSFSSQRAS